MCSPSTGRLSPLHDSLPGAEADVSSLSLGSPELCGEHEESLSVFCVDDLEPLCRQCGATGSHAGHRVYPLTEAATDCKEELRTSLDGLKKKVIHFDSVTKTSEDASKHNQAQAQLTEVQIKEEFKKLHQFLREEEEARLVALREEQEEKKREVGESMDRMTQAIESLEEKIQLIEEELDAEGNGVEFLQHYQGTSNRTRQSEEICGPLIDVAKHLGNLQYNVWDKMKHIAPYTPVTLDPRTACRSLRVSPGLNSVQIAPGPSQDLEQHVGVAVPVPANPERFHPYSCILAREGYKSGIHCWDIEVGDSNNWTIGIAGQSVCRREEFEACPEAGLWCISLREGEYRALTTPSQILNLDNSHRLKRARVRLDWDEGQLDFVDADTDALLFTFTHRFAEKVYPYFESISICGGGLAVLAQRVNVSVGSDLIPVEGTVITGEDKVTENGSSAEGEIIGIARSTDSNSKMLENRCLTEDKNPSTNVTQTQKKASMNEGKPQVRRSNKKDQLTKTKPSGKEKKTDSKTPVKKQTSKTRFNVTYHVSLDRARNIIDTSDKDQMIQIQKSF
ncbi:E3 ubiquitin-protein ligase TRIM35-like [Centroberyx affinis]|uniref:E3 ubiquitin-protein ligase TRIM35-like n=1 Tax=Centroberyx affinis TaxID=166261 RepID=UPI003A5C6FD6